MFQNRAGLASLLKDGGRHFSGLEEATYRNIDACKKLSTITSTSLGPNGTNKLVVNHIEKSFVTSDAATMVEQLEIQHPAAKMVALASKMQEQEFGDGTNLVIVFAGELLQKAEALLKEGLHIADITRGFEMALAKGMELLEESACVQLANCKSVEDLTKAAVTAVSSKALGSELQLARLIAEAVAIVMPPNPQNLNLDNVRVVKLVGGTAHQSEVIAGMVVARDTNGTVKSKSKCKVMVIGCGLEMAATEAKGTVLLNNADQLLNFTKGEEDKVEEVIKSIADAGVEVIVVGGAVSDLAQHFCNKFNLMVLKCQSKFELRRLCRTLGATALIKLAAPTPEELGFAETVSVEEISSKKVTILKTADSRVATIILRGASPSTLDEVERAIDDGVHCIKSMTKDNRFVPGAGAAELEVGFQLQVFGAKVPGLEQYAVVKYGEALECVARIIAENAGLKATEIITQLYAAHKQGLKNVGVDVEGHSDCGLIDAVTREVPIIDHFKTKEWALRLATDAALTVLRVDQIIMSRPAGGPAPPKQSGWDNDD